MNLAHQVADLEARVVGIMTVIKSIKTTLAGADQEPLKDKRGSFTPAGKIAILSFYAAGGSQKEAREKFEISKSSARDYWYEHLRQTGQLAKGQ